MYGCTAARNHFHWSPFSFSESRTAFSFACKRKSGFGPSRAGKKLTGRQNTPLSHKRKSGFTRKMHAPSIRRPSRATSAHPFRTPTQAAWISTNKERYSTHSTAVAQKGPRVAQTQAAEDRRIAQRILPEEQHLSIGNLSCCNAPPQDFHWSTFSFSESRTAFSFESKEKVVLAPAGQAKKQSPAGQAKNNCKIKRTTFPQKRKRFYLPHP